MKCLIHTEGTIQLYKIVTLLTIMSIHFSIEVISVFGTRTYVYHTLPFNKFIWYFKISFPCVSKIIQKITPSKSFYF